MTSPDLWPSASYEDWSKTCDTLHAHTQVLGKIAAKLAPPEPQLQHAALRLTTRGWETAPLPAPDGSGTLVVALDLHRHEAVAEHSDGRERRLPLTPHRAVGEVTRELLAAVGDLVGAVEIDPTPQEVPWSAPLDEDTEHLRKLIAEKPGCSQTGVCVLARRHEMSKQRVITLLRLGAGKHWMVQFGMYNSLLYFPLENAGSTQAQGNEVQVILT